MTAVFSRALSRWMKCVTVVSLLMDLTAFELRKIVGMRSQRGGRVDVETGKVLA
jgi:hypothetical protein